LDPVHPPEFEWQAFNSRSRTNSWRLSPSAKDIDAEIVVELRRLLSRGKKPKADEFIRVLTAPPGGEVK
jgi:hypothetical protein